MKLSEEDEEITKKYEDFKIESARLAMWLVLFIENFYPRVVRASLCFHE